MGLPQLLALLVILVLSILWAVRYAAWYRDWQYSRMPLAALLRERESRNSHDPILLYRIGLCLLREGRFTAADGYLREAVGRDPDSALYRDAWARALLGSGLTSAAFGELRQYAGTHPHSADAHLLLGKFYLTQKSMRRAAEELSVAVRLDSGNGEAWAYLAAARHGLNELPQAREAAEKASALRPRNPGDRLLVAALRASAGDTPGARRAFEESIALGPNLVVARREFAKWLLTSGADAGRALEEAKRAVDLQPGDPAGQLVLGRALIACGRAEEAVEPLRRAAVAAPFDPAPALVLAQTERRIGNLAEADEWSRQHDARQTRLDRRDQLRAILELNGDDGDANRRLARLLAEEKDVEGCVRHHARALRKPPDSAPALVAAADDLLAAGHAAEALPVARRAYEIARANPAANETLGNALLATGKPQEATAFFNRVTAWKPEKYPVFREKLSRYYRESSVPQTQSGADKAYRKSCAAMRGQVRVIRVPKEALDLAYEAARLEPESDVYLRHLLKLQIHSNQKKEAIESARRLLTMTPDDLTAHALLGVLLIERETGPDELAEAEKHLDLAAASLACAPTWHYGRGLLALKRGQGESAARELREAARLDPRPDVTFYKLSIAERKAGRPEAAERALAEYHRRHQESEAEANALRSLGMRVDDPAEYERAAAVFSSYGRKADAAAIREAAPTVPRRRAESQTGGS